ncbi:MAG: hypothetical protein ACKVU1_02645 [bacterium]
MAAADTVFALTTPDGNWFYSSLAQSAATLVGLIGSVLALRLQAQLERVRRSRDAVLDHFRANTHYSLGMPHKAKAAREATIEGLRELRLLIAASRPRATVTAVDWANLSVHRRDDVPANEKTAEHMESEILELEDIEKHGRALCECVDIESFSDQKPRFEGLKARLKHAPGLIDPCLRQMADLHVKQERHYETARIGSSVLTVLVLAGIGIASVVMPLSKLTATPPGERGGYLWAFAVGIAALVVLLALQLREINVEKRLRIPRDPSWLLSP